MKKVIMAISLSITAILIGCTDAQVASSNLSKAAEQFQIERRVVFYNGITGEYMLSIQGLCSLSPESTKITVTCKTGPDEYKKHYLGLSDNVTYFAEQLNVGHVSTNSYKVIFKPSVIIPDVDLK
jgi:hypothetical protein